MNPKKRNQEKQNAGDQKSSARRDEDPLNDIYIPKDLKDCFLQLDNLLSAGDKEQIKNLKDRSETIRYHFNLGLWIRNNWGLWRDSRLQKYFMDRKIFHPDDMSSLILENYYDWLNNRYRK